jgi:hypothetical protein
MSKASFILFRKESSLKLEALRTKTWLNRDAILVRQPSKLDRTHKKLRQCSILKWITEEIW